ncbi:MAG: hypothetical protein GY862_03780 [Gammaproteobacteria bacterium]|nr:hypothetical protein [Gammaproteobacteria bacterium]
MVQLASRLHDHVPKKQDGWEPEPLQTPLILLEERKLDSTLSVRITEGGDYTAAWWISASADFSSTGMLSDEEWAKSTEDIPVLEKLLSVIEHDGQNWRLLTSYLSWDRRDEEADRDEPYRHMGMNIHSYLIHKQDFAIAYACLDRRNFFGEWMPEGVSWLHGFAGEYPWATPFNTEPDEWHGRGGHNSGLPVTHHPTWNELGVEWEYDASIPRNLHMPIPARTFFLPGDLWWDGKDGYRLVNGRTVFRDPSVTEAGPAALLADTDDLLERLNTLDLRLIWTVVGEKLILGGRYDKITPRRTFSQIACLDENGSLQIGDRVFFDDYNQDAGPRTVRRPDKR